MTKISGRKEGKANVQIHVDFVLGSCCRFRREIRGVGTFCSGSRKVLFVCLFFN